MIPRIRIPSEDEAQRREDAADRALREKWASLRGGGDPDGEATPSLADVVASIPR